ncbi:uncharacterized protein LOC115895217 [Rhinopithecus roxellana]|uniref:uncharacterized protein LOC115895217 n=1 Tax=Rhinopithecus roxellana TaxID=61622 RepID=UPI00123731C8|nr:uncharacterized protein LOC115895217 [Rhinopithecus roxellana]XP_030780702.1 uncharacterized protein LOC115895217 [Rhinopithecus roxellana]XP_030780703.1 uncharacterized protein LOC115895217 [Rhinopithecus roxellana]XP_030780705.1 uncharacterized protein LOC115895217 [Rhinopithecus roxellana]
MGKEKSWFDKQYTLWLSPSQDFQSKFISAQLQPGLLWPHLLCELALLIQHHTWCQGPRTADTESPTAALPRGACSGEVRLWGWGPALILPGFVTLGKLLSLSELLLPLLWSGLIPATPAPMVVPWLTSAKHGAMENTQQGPAPCLALQGHLPWPSSAFPPCSQDLCGSEAVQVGFGNREGPGQHTRKQRRRQGSPPQGRRETEAKIKRTRIAAFCPLEIFKSKWGGGGGRFGNYPNGIVSHCWLGATLCSGPKYPLEVTPQKGTSPKERGQREDPGHPTPCKGRKAEAPPSIGWAKCHASKSSTAKQSPEGGVSSIWAQVIQPQSLLSLRLTCWC